MPKRYYITTPIYYVNSVPHIGTALTTVAADITSRYWKLRGHDVFFVTGTDENATKVAEAARSAGKEPQAFVDEISSEFRRIWDGLNIAYDDFIRTTEPRHVHAVQEVFDRLLKAGHIYRDKYEGWYDVSAETFFKESDLIDGKSPEGNDVRWVEEENYFFRLSAFQDRLLEHIQNNHEFILPETRRNEVVSFIRQGLRDACITRSNAGWGIPVRGDEGHVIYVWFDALINYITAAGWPDGAWQNCWPADVEWMGKDILVRFHATLWPAMLMGLDLPLPKTMVGHGWVLIGGEKISKTRGNVIAPLQIAADLAARSGCSQDLAVDAVRYYMARTMPFENDYTFTPEDFDLKFNTELVNDLSNGIHRLVSMTTNFLNGDITAGQLDAALVGNVRQEVSEFERSMAEFRIDTATGASLRIAQIMNKYIDDKKPWDLNKAGAVDELNFSLRNLVWVSRACAGTLKPIAPALSDRICELIGSPKISDWDSIMQHDATKSVRVAAPTPIYNRLEKKKLDNETIEPSQQQEITIEDLMKLDLRVARILDAAPVSDSDKLIRLDLIIGDEKRQVLAGIAKQYTPESLIGRQVILIANLKPRKMRGLESQGMILAADGPGGEAILLQPDKEAPEGASVH
jgi:methionyl-tRNA synthetase